MQNNQANPLCPFASDSPSQLNILRHNGDSLRMNSTKICIFKQTDQVRLCRLLKRRHGTALEPQIGFEVLCDLTNQSLKRKLSDQKLSTLLVFSDLTECDGSRAKTMGLLDSAGGWSWLSGGFGGQLLSGSLASGGFSGSLFGACHSNRLV